MTQNTNQRQYKNPPSSPSSIGVQMEEFHWYKKALIEMAKEQYFGQMASVREMPKHFGKKIKQYHYLPMLDDANINDQGIDAAGVTTTRQVTIKIIPSTAGGVSTVENIHLTHYAVGEGANDAAALTAAQARALYIMTKELGVVGADYAAAKTDATNKGFTIVDNLAAVPVSGNMYDSSKDVGYVTGKLPLLSETGGRVNRVGFKRIDIEGSMEKLGFFDEYTQESLDFDSDSELRMHTTRIMLEGANEITEDMLQMDLLSAAGIVMYGGNAVSTGTITGEGTISKPSYKSLMKLDIALTNNRTPKHTTMITGSRMVDTNTIEGARYMYIGSELETAYRTMVDTFGSPAFIPAHKYAAAGTLARGEIGAVGPFRIVVVPEMMHWAGAGAAVTANEGYRETNNKYDVFPALVIGNESFTTIGFQTDGKSVKFNIINKAPGESTADRLDPFGETGFTSIKWYYGFMALRAERIALIKQVAEW